MAKKPSKPKHAPLHAIETSRLQYREHIGGKAAVDLLLLKLSDAMTAVAAEYPAFAAGLFNGVEMTAAEHRRLLGRLKSKPSSRSDRRVTFIGFLNAALLRMRGDNTPRLGYYLVDGKPIPTVVTAIPITAELTLDNTITPREDAESVVCRCGRHKLSKPDQKGWSPAVIVPAKPKRKR
jgi:hypothetical protein